MLHFYVRAVGTKKNSGKLLGPFRPELNIQHGKFVQQLPGMEAGEGKLEKLFINSIKIEVVDSLFILPDLEPVLLQMKKKKPCQVHPQGSIQVLLLAL